jgi:hypothetical protein
VIIMDAELKRRILDQAHANIARLSEMKTRAPDPLLDDDAASRSHDPVRRSCPGGRPPPEPTPRGLDTAPTVDWAAIDQRIEQRVEAERAIMLAVVGEALGQAIGDAREEHQKELREQALELKKAVGNLESAIHKLAAAEAKTTIDLPPLPTLRRTDVN